ncbi:NF-kappa-B inhibitor-interacting Ras-like protein 1 isoform X2 [Ailuropoda melanoleuca]|uniref:NF-kappa-B inhibitor-interacting Ras-like protein 1 isoform X2 n=1 Tax=Ailuropoda melanoleuca TaxID=9646 RepID=UPI001495033E|nr:NF-kappa-B inhibitor-interacting Ras-like protein 1 isoform X2 [Ailuropoda melanoleuca]
MGKGCKVVVCGLLSVGKTAILEQLLYGNHTIGMEDCETMEDVYMASVETDRGVKEQLHLYDTRGLQEGVELPKHYFSFADGFVLVYSVNNLESFQRVELLKKEIDKFKDKKEVAIVVLGNKIDLSEQRQVDAEVAQQWARSEKVRLWERDTLTLAAGIVMNHTTLLKEGRSACLLTDSTKLNDKDSSAPPAFPLMLETHVSYSNHGTSK